MSTPLPRGHPKPIRLTDYRSRVTPRSWVRISPVPSLIPPRWFSINNTSQAGWWWCRLGYEPLNWQHRLGHQLSGIRTADPCGGTSNSNHSAMPLSLLLMSTPLPRGYPKPIRLQTTGLESRHGHEFASRRVHSQFGECILNSASSRNATKVMISILLFIFFFYFDQTRRNIEKEKTHFDFDYCLILWPWTDD